MVPMPHNTLTTEALVDTLDKASSVNRAQVGMADVYVIKEEGSSRNRIIVRCGDEAIAFELAS